MEVLVSPAAENGWTVLATPGSREGCADGELLQAYQEQHTTGAPGFRWSKTPAAISPVWLEQPARIAAWAMLTVVGWRVYRVIPRQVRLSRRTHDLQWPGHKGATATPTGAVGWSWFAPVAVAQLRLGNAALRQVYGVHHSHLVVCDALGLDHTWSAVADSA